MDWSTKKWFIAGHRGLAGGALHRALTNRGVPENKILTRNRQELDLRNQSAVSSFFERNRPDIVLLAAAVVGGIEANRTFPVTFLEDNLTIQNNVISSAHRCGSEKLLFLGSSCIYPRDCPQPMKPEYLLSGPLEPTNQWYALAKIAGIKLCEAYQRQFGQHFISVMPTNLYGPGDNYHPEHSHVLPAFIRKFHEAKVTESDSVTCWGDGSPKREFLFSEDFADACLFALKHYEGNELLNIGSQQEISIRDLADLVAGIVGFEGTIQWDASMPNGTPRKLMDSTVLRSLGWQPSFSLEQGIQRAYEAFLEGYTERSIA